MPRHASRLGAAVLSISLVFTLIACSSGGSKPGARPGNPQGIEVLSEESGSGADTSRALLSSSSLAVVSAPDPQSQARAASIAVGLGAPMLTSDQDAAPEVLSEVKRLGVDTVLRVGAAVAPGIDATVVDAPTAMADLRQLTGIDFTGEEAQDPRFLDDATVHQSRERPALLSVRALPPPDPVPLVGGAAPLRGQPAAFAGAEAPTVLVHEQTPLAAIATAVATGAAVAHLRAPDPRVDGGSVAEVSTAAPVLALGPGWGSSEVFASRVEQARTEPQLPGGGQILFPGRRFVAAYGSPVSPALGMLGEQGPSESVARISALANQYQPYSPEPVVPAFEIIGTVASGGPGPDGNYSNEWPASDLIPLVDGITEAGGYAVIDLQPGSADLLDQAKSYTDLLRRPNVGLALDPEWKLRPGQHPGAQIGSVDAEEINRVSRWLADLTKESGGPQKMLILHQFSTGMIANRERIDTSREEVAIVLHADGHGSPGTKMDTWSTLRQGLNPAMWMGWKNFLDEDTPTFTPEQTMGVSPRPWFVSYQ